MGKEGGVTLPTFTGRIKRYTGLKEKINQKGGCGPVDSLVLVRAHLSTRGD